MRRPGIRDRLTAQAADHRADQARGHAKPERPAWAARAVLDQAAVGLARPAFQGGILDWADHGRFLARRACRQHCSLRSLFRRILWNVAERHRATTSRR